MDHGLGLAAVVVGVAVAISACSGDGGSAADLPPLAAEGRRLANSNGCAACHGTSGQGAVGPALAGLFGSDVELDDGTVVVADEAYLRESIADPRAKVVDGFSLPMPDNDLDDDEIAAVIAYIRALGAHTTEDGR